MLGPALAPGEARPARLPVEPLAILRFNLVTGAALLAAGVTAGIPWDATPDRRRWTAGGGTAPGAAL